MKTTRRNKISALIILVVFAMISAVYCLFTFGEKNVQAESLVSQTFVMEDGVSAKLSENGGIRFRVKMDETTKNNIVNNDDVTLEFVIALQSYFKDGSGQTLTIPVDENKIYEEDGFYYANGVMGNIGGNEPTEEFKKLSRTSNFQAIARIKNGSVVTDTTAVNDNARNSLYSVLNSAVLDTKKNYEELISRVSAYSEWFGTEQYPIKINSNEKYASLKTKMEGEFFKDKYYSVSTDVSDFNASELTGLDNISNTVWYVGTAPVAKGGLTYNESEYTLIDTVTPGKGTFMYKLGEDGEWSETVPTATNAGNYTVYYKVNGDGVETQEKSLSVNIAKAQNAISEFTVANVTHGETPNPQNATSTFGDVVITYANADKSKTGAWNEVYEKAGMYFCKVSVEGNDNYNSTSYEKPFTVFKASGSISITLNDSTLICGHTPDYTVKKNGNGAVTLKYARVKNSEYRPDIREWLVSDDGIEYADLVGNGFTYYVKAFIESDGCYEGAESEAQAVTLMHDFKEGVCKGCGHAQTGIQYAVDGDVAYVTGYAGNPSTEIFVNATYQGKPVTYVKDNVFNSNDRITKVVLPSSVTELKGGVFLNCYNLTYVDMRSVTTIGGNNNFLNCDKLATVIIGDGYTATDQQFVTQQGSAIIELFVNGTTPVSLSGNDKLIKSIYYKGTAEECNVWYFENDVIKTSGDHSYTDGKCGHCGLYNETLTQGVVYKYDSASDRYYVGDNNSLNVSEVTILGTYNDGKHGERAVTYVKDSAFKENPHIRRVILPASVTELKGLVFFGCGNLEYLDMRGVTTFGGNDVTFCYNLTTVIVKEGITIPGQQFQSGDENKNGVTTIYVDGTAEITIGNADLNKLIGKIIYKRTPGECSGWYFENDVIKIADHSFTDGKCVHCGLYSETLTQGVVYKYDSVSDTYYVGDNRSLNVSEVKILGTYNDGKHKERPVTYVAFQAFIYNNSITKVILPESVTTLGGGAFMHCTKLQYVDMRGVSSLIMTNAPAGPDGSRERNNNFLGCSQLTTIVVGKAFKSDVGQFHDTNKPNLYVYGTASDGVPSTADISKVGKIYYYDANGATGCWNYVGDVATLH